MSEKVDVEIINEGKAAVMAFKAATISDVRAIDAVSRQINEFIDENHPSRVVIDFKQVRFFSSQLLGVLLGIRARLQTYNGEIVISAIEPQLHRVFKITNLDRIFKFFPDRESAVKGVDTN